MKYIKKYSLLAMLSASAIFSYFSFILNSGSENKGTLLSLLSPDIAEGASCATVISCANGTGSGSGTGSGTGSGSGTSSSGSGSGSGTSSSGTSSSSSGSSGCG